MALLVSEGLPSSLEDYMHLKGSSATGGKMLLGEEPPATSHILQSEMRVACNKPVP